MKRFDAIHRPLIPCSEDLRFDDSAGILVRDHGIDPNRWVAEGGKGVQDSMNVERVGSYIERRSYYCLFSLVGEAIS